MATWMIYCTVLATLLAGGAWLFEKLVHLHRGETRRVWALALLGAVLGPVFVWLWDVEYGTVGGSGIVALPLETRALRGSSLRTVPTTISRSPSPQSGSSSGSGRFSDGR